MSCNPTRIELSNDATTTVSFTVSPEPTGTVVIYFDVPGLSIDEQATLSDGEASIDISAVSGDTNSIYDATIQVGTGAAVAADVQVVDSSSAQAVGVTVSGSSVTYCAPSGSGGGSGDLLAANNLSDLDDADTALGNLGGNTAGIAVFKKATSGEIRGQLSLGTASIVDTGIGTGDIPTFSAGVADNDFLKIDGTTVEGRSDSETRTDLGITNLGSYTGQIETITDSTSKDYILDPYVPADVTISRFRAYLNSGSGSVTVELMNGSSSVKSFTASTTTTGDQTGLSNTSVSAGEVLKLATSSGSSATDLVFLVEYEE